MIRNMRENSERWVSLDKDRDLWSEMQKLLVWTVLNHLKLWKVGELGVWTRTGIWDESCKSWWFYLMNHLKSFKTLKGGWPWTRTGNWNQRWKIWKHVLFWVAVFSPFLLWALSSLEIRLLDFLNNTTWAQQAFCSKKSCWWKILNTSATGRFYMSVVLIGTKHTDSVWRVRRWSPILV